MPDIDFTETKHWIRTARTIIEALPYLKRYEGRTFVVKYGGHAMGDEKAAAAFAQDIVLLRHAGINPVVVHGGGPQINQMLERLKIQSTYVRGLRVTDAATVEIVEMVLAGSINKQIVGSIGRAGGTAVGLSGKDGALIMARKLTRTERDPGSNIERALDLGFVGEPERVDPALLERLTAADIIPVIAPIGLGANGETYNINADTVAGHVAAATGAARFFLLTDVPGVLDKDKNLLPELTLSQCRALIEDGTISGGMIPKVETCMHAVEHGVEGAVIMDGRLPHQMLLEIFTARGVGTLVKKG
jgi:acetylglutamate kinase